MSFQNAVTDELYNIFDDFVKRAAERKIPENDLRMAFRSAIMDYYSFIVLTSITFSLYQCFGSDFRAELAKMLLLKDVNISIQKEDKIKVMRILLPVIDSFCNGDFSVLLNNTDIRDRELTIFPYS